MRTTTVRRAQSVVWLSDEMMSASDDGGLTEAETVMRAKVLNLVNEEERAWVRLVSIRRLDPHDPEFDTLARADAAVPEGCSPWVGVWEVRP